MLLQESVFVIHRWAAFNPVGLKTIVIVASHGVTHEIMHHLAIGSSAGG